MKKTTYAGQACHQKAYKKPKQLFYLSKALNSKFEKKNSLRPYNKTLHKIKATLIIESF